MDGRTAIGMYEQTDRWINEQRDRETDRETERQTDRQSLPHEEEGAQQDSGFELRKASIYKYLHLIEVMP